MDVRAILVLGATEATRNTPPSETIAGTPFGLTDVLGKPIIYHVLDRMRAKEITAISVITDADPGLWPDGTTDREHGRWIQTNTENLWRTVEQVFCDFAQSGAELVIVHRVGAYAEIDYDCLVQFHVDNRCHVTRVVDEHQMSLDIFAISASRRNDAAFMFRHQLCQFRTQTASYHFRGYSNRLTSPHDLRHLAVEALMQRIQIKPDGREIKPGIWAGRGAHVHKRARILSPAFIGAGSKVSAASVITRCTVLEHHTIVDCGSVIEDVSTLPYTYVGAGLDVAHSIVGHHRLWNLKREVEVEFSDSKLVGRISSRAPLRAVGNLAALASFVPVRFLRGLFTPSHRESPASLPEAISTPSTGLKAPVPPKAPAPAVDAGEFPSNFVVARRYGND